MSMDSPALNLKYKEVLLMMGICAMIQSNLTYVILGI